VVGYTPAKVDKAERDAAWERIEARAAQRRAEGFDEGTALASLGMDPDGNPLEEC